jgi:hypothetical protein
MAIDNKLIDQLLTDYKKTRGYHRGERAAQTVDQSHSGTSAGGRDDRSSGL